jgi:hypothetical protein
VRLLPHDGEAPLRAGTTATISIDTGRERRLGDIVTTLLGRTSANAASPK